MVLSSQQPENAFTRIELLALLSSFTLVATLFVSGTQLTHKQSLEAGCLFNLRSLGNAAFSWSADHDGKYPWHVPPYGNYFNPEEGSKGVLNAWQHFYVMRKDVVDPRKLGCPTDRRKPAENWERGMPNALFSADKQNNAVSYFIGLHAESPSSRNLLFGDRNLTGGSPNNLCSVINAPAGYAINLPAVRWDSFMHGPHSGNVVFSDGSSEKIGDAVLKQLGNQSDLVNGTDNRHLLLP